MAFKSQSALAQVACQTPSGAMSGNLSHGNTLSSSTCLGTKPATYATFLAGSPSSPPWPTSLGLTKPVLQIYVQGSGASGSWQDVTLGLSPLLLSLFYGAAGASSTLTAGQYRVKGATSDSGFGSTFAQFIGQTSTILVPVLPTRGNPSDNTTGTVNVARDVSIFEVLWFPTNVSATLGQLAQYCVAAYFNAKANPSSTPVTAEQVKHIWHDIAVIGGKYCALSSCGPSGGWDATQAAAYLASTFSP